MTTSLPLYASTLRCLRSCRQTKADLKPRGSLRAYSTRNCSIPQISNCRTTNSSTVRPQSFGSPQTCRAFTTSTPFCKKGGKSKQEEVVLPEAEDPYDFSTLEAGISKATKKLETELGKLKTGGRFNPEVLENVRVALNKNDPKSTVKLGDLAQVLPKGGRNIMVLVGEQDHVKPIISAIQASKDLNLTPQQDPHTATQLNIPVPPPTKESRYQALNAAAKAGETAAGGVRLARGAMQKRLRAMELRKVVRPDDLRKASRLMEGVVERGTAAVKQLVEDAKKGMMQA